MLRNCNRSPVIEIQGKELQGVKITVTHFFYYLTDNAMFQVNEQYFGRYTARILCLAM